MPGQKENPVPYKTLVVLLCVGAAVAAGCGENREERAADGAQGEAPIVAFNKRVNDYAEWRRKMIGPLDRLDDTKTPQEIAKRESGLADRITKERKEGQGALFTPDVAPILIARIKDTYKTSPLVRETRKDAEDEVPDFVPQVNTPYPTTHPLGTFPPTLLAVLPELPKELEYRIVTHHLILRDIEANTVVDVLPHAIP